MIDKKTATVVFVRKNFFDCFSWIEKNISRKDWIVWENGVVDVYYFTKAEDALMFKLSCKHE